MTDRPLRVVVWGTGNIGRIAINTIRARPGMELVGAWVHSQDKVGADVGELARGAPLGVKATNDADALLALKPDCIVYTASAPERDAAAVPDLVRILKAGVNVVNSTTSRAIYPPRYDPWNTELEAAAKEGGASFYASGIEPGFAADHLPLALATQSSRIRSIYAAEILLYDDYPVAFMMMDAMGFGRPMDYVPPAARPGGVAYSWAPSIHLIADACGVKVDEIRESFLKSPATRTVEVACGTIEEGTCGAVRITATGVVNGKEAIVVEHVNRMHRDFAPEWPQGDGDCTYVTRIEGDPDIDNRLTLKLKDPPKAGFDMKAGAGAMMATAMRLVNAIPYIVAAEPGLHSAVTLPLTAPKQAFA